jgi:hypothetical protein
MDNGLEKQLLEIQKAIKKAYQNGYEDGKGATLDEKKIRAEEAQIDELEQKDEKEFNDVSEDLA